MEGKRHHAKQERLRVSNRALEGKTGLPISMIIVQGKQRGRVGEDGNYEVDRG